MDDQQAEELTNAIRGLHEAINGLQGIAGKTINPNAVDQANKAIGTVPDRVNELGKAFIKLQKEYGFVIDGSIGGKTSNPIVQNTIHICKCGKVGKGNKMIYHIKNCNI